MDKQEALSIVSSNLVKAKSFCKDWHSNIEHWRDLYNFKHYAGTPPKEGEPRYVDPTYTNTVDLTVGIFMANGKNWIAKGWSPSKKEQKNSDSIEKYLSGVIESNSARYQCDLDYEINLNFTRDGCGILFSPWDRDIQFTNATIQTIFDVDTESPKQLNVITEIPIHTRVIDPLSIYLLPGGKRRWAVIARIEKSTIYDVECEFGVQLERYRSTKIEDKMSTYGEFVDYWDFSVMDGVSVVRNAVLFNNEFVFHPEDPLKIMTGYNDIPYTISFYKPTSRDKAEQWSSIIHPLEPAVSNLERNMNRLQEQINKFSSLPLVIRSVNNQLSVDPGIAKALNIGPDDSIELPSWPGNPPDVYHMLDFLRSRIQQTGFSDVMYGGGSEMSGYAISQLGDQSRIRLEQPITHLEKLWTWWAKKVIDLTSTFAAGSYLMVNGTIRGADFSDIVNVSDLIGYNIRCEIKPDFPNEKVRNHAMASQVKGIVSETTLLQNYLGIQQPEDERKRKLIEAAEQHPVAQQYALLKTLVEMAEEGDVAAGMVVQSMRNGGIQGQGGRPTEPTNAMQPAGLQSSTGQPTPQAQGNPQPGGSMIDAMNNMATAAPNMQGGVQ